MNFATYVVLMIITSVNVTMSDVVRLGFVLLANNNLMTITSLTQRLDTYSANNHTMKLSISFKKLSI